MVSSSKILTVSYGTFSCTLEGFDNSFDTMKAIAEYFRDLAQDDRYFGAEPPTPDTEMLARIAEREIERRVEARFEQGNLVLRPTDDAEPPQGDVAPAPSSGAALMGAAAGAAATGLAAVALRADEEAEAQPEIETQDMALDLADLDVAEEVEDAAAPVVESSQESMDDVEERVADVDLPEDLTDLVEDAPVEEETPAVEIEEPNAEVIEAPSAATDTVADKLERIRAVVASKSQEEPEYIEDEHAMPGLDGDGDDENDAIDTDTPMPALANASELLDDDLSDLDDDLDDDEDNLFADTIAAIVNDEIEEDDDAALVEAAMPQEDDSEQLSDTEAELAALRAKIAELEAQATASEVRPDMEAPAEEETPEVAEDEPAPVVAHVQKVKRADIEAALDSGQLEEVEDDEDASDDAEPLPGAEDSSLTAEQEQELARELADLQAEIDSDEDWDFDVAETEADGAEDAIADAVQEAAEEAEANVRKAVKLTNPARAMLTDTSIEEDDGSVDRLIDQTETEMDEPEGNRRRSAIAHLRAAVAATKADRLLGMNKKKADEEEPYREDLADAVRPRRPKVSEARSERPAAVRPAPLQLVAEQRVDTDDDAPQDVKPVRPRRVMRTEAADTAAEAPGNDTGFAEFAESQGAHSLPELLEAAASYMSFVEGREQFSRPQLMTKLHQTDAAESSREERLRSFGQLLRDGKIQKKGGGRFTASDSIGFKPKARAAG